MRQGLRNSRARRRNPFARARFIRLPFRHVHGRSFGRHVRPLARLGHLSGILSVSRSDRTPPNRHRNPVGRACRSAARRYAGERRRSCGTSPRTRRHPTAGRRGSHAARMNFATRRAVGRKRSSRPREKFRRLRFVMRKPKRHAHPPAERYRMINLTFMGLADIFAKFRS